MHPLRDRCSRARAQAESGSVQRDFIAASIMQLLGDDTAVLLPSTPGPAPRSASPLGCLGAYWHRMICLTAPSGLAGVPQARG